MMWGVGAGRWERKWWACVRICVGRVVGGVGGCVGVGLGGVGGLGDPDEWGTEDATTQPGVLFRWGAI